MNVAGGRVTVPRRSRAVTAAATATILLTLSASPGMAKPEPQLVNEELVVATLDASGLPTDATLYSRVVARDYPRGEVRDPSSTTELGYVDRRGAPDTDGEAVLVTVGGAGETAVTTQAAFTKPLPIAVHAQYQQGPDVLPPADVEGIDGQVRIRYTVTNTTAKEEVIRYRDASGRWTVRKEPVFAPFVGTLIATLPAGVTLLEAPNAVRSTTPDGRTQLQWNLVLYPPMGNYQQDVEVLVSGDPVGIPSLSMQAVPVTGKQSPTLSFSTDLLSASVQGNEDLAGGLTDLNDATATLATGANRLTRGLSELGSGTSTLAQQVNAILVPGSQQLAQGALDVAKAQRRAARGANDLAKGQREAAKGANKLADAQAKAADGTRSAYAGAQSLEDAAARLSDGLLSLYDGLQELLKPGALPAARDSADQLSQAVLRIRDVIGSPNDPDIGFPPTQGSTLIQAVRAAKKAAGVSAAGSQKVQSNLKDIAATLADLSQQAVAASTSAASAELKAASVYAQACGVAPVLDAATCATLQQAVADAGVARQATGDIAFGVGGQSGKVMEQAIATTAITASLAGMAAIFGYLDVALAGISGALVSGTTSPPGIYEGLQALTDGLTATINGLVALSNGAAQSTGGAQLIAQGTQDLSQGLDDLAAGTDELSQGSADLAQGSNDLAEGSEQLAQGSNELAQGTEQLAQGSAQQADGTAKVGTALNGVTQGVEGARSGAEQVSSGARQLSAKGTQRILDQVVKASRDPAFASAYLKASAARAADALPYGAPEGAQGRVAYVYTLTGTEQDNRTASWASWGLLALFAAGVGAVAWRRLHPAPAVAAAAAVPEPDSPEPEAQPEPEPEAEPEPEVEPEPEASSDNDWLFRPPDEQAPN